MGKKDTSIYFLNKLHIFVNLLNILLVVDDACLEFIAIWFLEFDNLI